MATPPKIPRGRRVGPFRIEEFIARGGMASVYRATHHLLDYDVALKILQRGRETSEDDVARFLKEGRNLKKIKHPNVVRILDLGEDGELVYLAMEFISESLAEHLHGRLLTPQEAVTLAEQIGGALDAGHDLTILHRDVKPANILYEDGIFYLADFGISRALADTQLTQHGEFVGSYNYASPEQLRRAALTKKSDQYSLARVVHEVLTGNSGLHLADAPTRHPTRMAHPVVVLPTALDAVVRRAMSEAPELRWPDCATFASALAQAVQAPTPSVPLGRAAEADPSRPAPEPPPTSASQIFADLRPPRLPNSPSPSNPRAPASMPRVRQSTKPRARVSLSADERVAIRELMDRRSGESALRAREASPSGLAAKVASVDASEKAATTQLEQERAWLAHSRRSWIATTIWTIVAIASYMALDIRLVKEWSEVHFALEVATGIAFCLGALRAWGLVWHYVMEDWPAGLRAIRAGLGFAAAILVASAYGIQTFHSVSATFS